VERLRRLNPEIHVEGHPVRLDESNTDEVVAGYDLGYRYHICQVAGFAGRPAGANTPPVRWSLRLPTRSAPATPSERSWTAPAIVGTASRLGDDDRVKVSGSASKIMVVDMHAVHGMRADIGGRLRPGDREDRSRSSATREAVRSATLPCVAEQTIASMVRTASMRPAAVNMRWTATPNVSPTAMHELMLLDQRARDADQVSDAGAVGPLAAAP
jgi:hypothetical protein